MYIRLSLIALCLLFLLGCGQNDEDRALPSEKEDPNDRIINVKNSAPREDRDFSNEQIADHLGPCGKRCPRS